LSTGDEPATNPLPLRTSVESDSLMRQAFLAQWGCEAAVCPILRDEPALLENAVK